MITQQDDCYAAERALADGRRFATLEEVQSFVDSLREQPWWIAQGYHLRVLRVEVGAVGRGKKRSVGFYEESKQAGRIELAPHGMCEREVLHEVAHVIARAVHGSKSHDPWWARTLLTLVSYVMGPDAYLTLQGAFDAQGVDYTVEVAPAGRRVIAL